jgi:hypothetical protein
MPVEFLSDEQTAAYGRFNGAPGRAELERCFFLDDADRELVRRRRSEQPVDRKRRCRVSGVAVR